MIPTFPHFKKIELADKKSVETMIADFPPYSDFNFMSMWIWNVHGKMRLSKLNGNLVVLFSDYVDGEPFLSFIGHKKIIETTQTLIAYSKKRFHKDFLRLIPEELAPKYQYADSPFLVSTDRDAYDYVYLSENLGGMHSWKKDNSVETLRRFIKKYPHYKVVESSIKKIDDHQYRQMFHKWSEHKGHENTFELNEYKAFERFLKLTYKSIHFVSIFIDNILAGFSAYEILPNRYAIAHFSKGNKKDFPGIYNMLNWEEGRVLHARDIKFLNWEQDLGIPGIRYAKEKYKPYFLMKKVTISVKKDVL